METFSHHDLKLVLVLASITPDFRFAPTTIHFSLFTVFITA
jgi:hypothetical protein